MLFEKSTLASVVNVLIETMEKNYNFDLRPTLENLGLDLDKISVPGARYSDEVFDDIWAAILTKSGDDCVGLAIGRNIHPTTFHALGYAWFASRTLAGALRRLDRYDRLTYADLETDLNGGGKLSTEALTHHLIFGVGFSFSSRH
jgi:hypothetical protein